MLKQSVVLPGVDNARELGGYRIGDKLIKSGVLLRTGALNTALPEALDILRDRYSVQTVVDFRMSAEQRGFPDPEMPGADYLFLPVLETEDVRAGIDPVLAEKYGDPDMDRMTLFNAFYESGILGDRLYTKFLLSDRGIRAWRRFFEALLELEEGRSVLWHCINGKDRTGCAAMLILYALGADRDTVMADYLLTNEYNAAKLNAIRQKIAPLGWPEEKVSALLFMCGGVSEAYMNNAIDALAAEYGSVRAYLHQELGLGTAETEALKHKFLSALSR